MPHETPLIATIVVGLSLAFLFGAIAQRLRASPLVGYLLAGVVLGPRTPGFVADQTIASELAEVGIILLMFGVGLHFSLKDLWSVRKIAIPGAVVQIIVATLLGLGLSLHLGWQPGAGIVMGLALSVASTVVLLRAMQARRLLNTDRGRIAVGWLIVEDIVMVLTLVLLPALLPLFNSATADQPVSDAENFNLLKTFAVTVFQIVAFVVLMLVAGRRIIPWILHYAAHTGSRELFRLAVLAIALGTAFGAAKLFGVSFALGAFFAGMILSESTLSQQAASETLPLRDAFAVLFFISVGMLFDPAILLRDPLAVVATLTIVIVGKSVAAYGIVRAFGYHPTTALTISVSLAQIGEFSFILAGMGVTLGVLPELGRELVLAGAIGSIMLNPLLFFALDRYEQKLEKREAAANAVPEPAPPVKIEKTKLQDHAVLIGYGRVGRPIGETLKQRNIPMYVIDENDDVVNKLKEKKVEAVAGNAVALLKFANLPQAKCLLVAIPDSFEAGQIVSQARAANPELPIIVRGHSDAEVTHLKACGTNIVIQGSQEIADAMAARVP
ncbi:YbaL family putative K(+) efflux transporter [Hyphomicrobium facile]|uniref:Kef-type potassium/proton antiporter, CPA2 family n=1 Tax=Hyphomicrobium facile TaxID=51670 RepID=A0A1I7NT46_9HYPH|nr:YbaL family putative K(+) efflux transporter [Hyphomicrobium facile]SFV37780.1 Kef-type potassium/proton antiporter, CPA2 family [Hyphomicrobium facile]